MNEIDMIICRNNTQELLIQIKSKIQSMSIKDLYIVDSSEEEMVVLVSSQPITEQVAEAFWLGYKKALE